MNAKTQFHVARSVPPHPSPLPWGEAARLWLCKEILRGFRGKIKIMNYDYDYEGGDWSLLKVPCLISQRCKAALSSRGQFSSVQVMKTWPRAWCERSSSGSNPLRRFTS